MARWPLRRGHGIVCSAVQTLEWSWGAPRAAFTAPIAFFVELGHQEFLAVDTNGATWLVLGGEVQPYDMGEVGEPLVALSRGSSRDRRQWIGRTASGKLVLGSLKRAHTCEGIQADAIRPWSFRRGQTLVHNSDRGCWRQELPADTTGVASAQCGLGGAMLAFSRRQLFAEPLMCIID